MANSIAGKEKEFFNWKYNCMFFHSSLGYYCENVQQYFFNKSKAKELIETTGVGLAPGRAFGEAGEGWLRLCFASEPDLLSLALDRIEPALS